MCPRTPNRWCSGHIRHDDEGSVLVNNNGKRIVVLCILLVLGGGWAGLASRYTDQSSPAEPPVQNPDSALLDAPPSGSDANANLAEPPRIDLGTGGLVLRMTLAVVLVMGLGVAALYLSKKVLPRMTNTMGREIRVLETTCLGPRKALHLVEVGHQRLLIASTSDSVTMLTHVGDTWLELSRPEMNEAVKA